MVSRLRYRCRSASGSFSCSRSVLRHVSRMVIGIPSSKYTTAPRTILLTTIEPDVTETELLVCPILMPATRPSAVRRGELDTELVVLRFAWSPLDLEIAIGTGAEIGARYVAATTARRQLRSHCRTRTSRRAGCHVRPMSSPGLSFPSAMLTSSTRKATWLPERPRRSHRRLPVIYVSNDSQTQFSRLPSTK